MHCEGISCLLLHLTSFAVSRMVHVTGNNFKVEGSLSDPFLQSVKHLLLCRICDVLPRTQGSLPFAGIEGTAAAH